MPEAEVVAEGIVSPPRFSSRLKKRWRGWLRALHRDIGYLAVGFTVIYSLSGIAMNHIDDWDPNFHASEASYKLTPVADDMNDRDAARRVLAAAGLTNERGDEPTDVLRAGDEVRLTFADHTQVTAIGDTVTVQRRRDRLFFRVADWLHATRGKQAWKYIADAYAVLLFYLAISGLFMIKGKLGLRWRGTILMLVGLAAPIGYIVLSGGPGAQHTERETRKPGEADAPKPSQPPAPPAMRPTPPPAKPADDGITPLPPDDN